MSDELAQFWLPGSDDVNSGVLRIDNSNHVDLDLIGCLEPDRVPAGTQVGGFPRDLPPNADHHPLLRGITRSNRFVALIGVSGYAASALRIANGVSTVRDFSGHASLAAAYLVEDWSEDEQPTFDSIEFEIPLLQEVFSRSGQWIPFGQLPGVHGYVGTVTPTLSTMTVTVPDGSLVEFRQGIRNGSDEFTTVSVRRSNRSEVDLFLPLVTSLRSLVELATGSHQPVEGLIGIRDEPNRHTYSIKHPVQGKPSAPLSRRRKGLRFSLGDLVSLSEVKDVEKIAASIEADDPKRCEFLSAWVEWFAHGDNAAAVQELLRPVHDRDTSSNHVLRQTVGVLEHLTKTSHRPSGSNRVAEPTQAEVSQRNSLIATIGALPNPGNGSLEWAVKRLDDGVSSKGLTRRIGELLESTMSIRDCLLKDHQGNARDSRWFAQKLVGLRGSQSHGVGTSGGSTLSWYANRSRIFVLAVILNEIGVEEQQAYELLHSISHD